MPTQAELDWQNVVNTNRSKDLRASRETSRALKDKMNDALRNATSTKDRRAIKKQFNVDTNKASSQTDNQMGSKEDSNQRGTDDFKPTFNNVENDSSGGGLPEYPGDQPTVEIRAPLVWDDNNEEARWLRGTTQLPSDPKTYIDVFGYDPTPATDAYSLTRMEFTSGILCKDGAPIAGKIFFAEDET